MKKLKIDLLTLAGIILIVSAVIFIAVYYYYLSNLECMSDPVAYANNNSDDYGYRSVIAIR